MTGEKQQTLTSSFAEMLCPSSSLLYLGRTGKNKTNPATQAQQFVFLPWPTLSSSHHHCSPSHSIADLIWLINRHICLAYSNPNVLANPYLPTARLLLSTPQSLSLQCLRLGKLGQGPKMRALQIEYYKSLIWCQVNAHFVTLSQHVLDFVSPFLKQGKFNTTLHLLPEMDTSLPFVYVK